MRTGARVKGWSRVLVVLYHPGTRQARSSLVGSYLKTERRSFVRMQSQCLQLCATFERKHLPTALRAGALQRIHVLYFLSHFLVPPRAS